MSDFSMMQLADFDDFSPEVKKKLDRIFFRVRTMLGGEGIPVHLEQPDYETAFDRALQTYRTLSSRSIVQTYGFLELQPGQQVYTLNSRVDVVQRIFRGQGVLNGNTTGVFESFGAATANILLRGGGVGGAGGIDLATFDFLAQYQEVIQKLFAREINFTYRNETHQLLIHQPPRVKENVVLKISLMKSIGELLDDHWANDWMFKYTLAVSKTILGEKYTLFANIPGAQGGATTKGERLLTNGNDQIEKLEQNILEFGDSSDVPLPIRG